MEKIEAVAEKYHLSDGNNRYRKMYGKAIWETPPEFVFIGIAVPVGAVVGGLVVNSIWMDHFGNNASLGLIILGIFIGGLAFAIIAHFVSVFLGINSTE